jgi:hypothetical protein
MKLKLSVWVRVTVREGHIDLGVGEIFRALAGDGAVE